MAESYDFGKVLSDFFVNKGYTEMKDADAATNAYVPPKRDEHCGVDVGTYNELLQDYKNLSARSKKELTEAKEAAVNEFVSDIADSIIDLSKCTDVASKLVYNNLIKVLRKHGIAPMEVAPGDIFDTEKMHAVSLAGGNTAIDGCGECVVSRVYADGFFRIPTFKVIKPAMVDVMMGVE